MVTIREYGVVRLQADPEALRAASQRPPRVERSSHPDKSATLWAQLRRGRGLGIAPHARVHAAVRGLTRDPDYLAALAARAKPYLFLILGELRRRGLPAELALLPEVESQYNPRAVSPMAATGMWQFMSYTATEMGLKQNDWYDGRNDILASTRAALAYLGGLHRDFHGDWALALAAYNCGPACVSAALDTNRRAGKATDFWSLESLPAETRAYVPQLLAIVRLVRHPGRYGMRLPAIANRPMLEVVESRAQIDLPRAAALCGLPEGTLRALNPGLKKGKTAPDGPHRILIPVGTGDRLRLALAEAGGAQAGPIAARSRWLDRDS